jgi:hypothetical protein
MTPQELKELDFVIKSLIAYLLSIVIIALTLILIYTFL